MSNWTQADVDRVNARLKNQGRNAVQVQALPVSKPSKYRNVKTVIGSETFDSAKEAQHWLFLLARQSSGEIRNLQRQVRFALMAPTRDRRGLVHVAEYVADFVYDEAGVSHVIDVKSKATRTQTYRLKRKWLELQENIVIEEV